MLRRQRASVTVLTTLSQRFKGQTLKDSAGAAAAPVGAAGRDHSLAAARFGAAATAAETEPVVLPAPAGATTPVAPPRAAPPCACACPPAMHMPTTAAAPSPAALCAECTTAVCALVWSYRRGLNRNLHPALLPDDGHFVQCTADGSRGTHSG